MGKFIIHQKSWHNRKIRSMKKTFLKILIDIYDLHFYTRPWHSVTKKCQNQHIKWVSGFLNITYDVSSKSNAIYTCERITHARIRSPETEFLYYNFQLYISLFKYFKIILIHFGIRFCLFKKEVPSLVNMIYCSSSIVFLASMAKKNLIFGIKN